MIPRPERLPRPAPEVLLHIIARGKIGRSPEAELTDRFGPLPPQVQELFVTVRSRKLAVELGFERMILKDSVLKCYFINRPDSPYFESDLFKNVLDFLQTGTNKARLKQVGKLFMLVMEPARDMQDVYSFLKRMHTEGVAQPA